MNKKDKNNDTRVECKFFTFLALERTKFKNRFGKGSFFTHLVLSKSSSQTQKHL